MTLSQHGFIKLSVLLAAVFGLGLGASGYLNFAQHQRSAQDEKLLQGQIVDLRYQVAQDKVAMGSPSPSPSPSDSPSPSPEASPSPSPSSTPAVAGASTSPQSTTLKQLAKLHSQPSQRSSILGEFPAGTLATLGSAKSGGYQQVTINGKTGYVVATYLN